MLAHSHASRPQQKRQRAAARENRSAHASPERASISRPITRRRAKLHRRQRARRSLSDDRDAAFYVLTTNGHEWTLIGARYCCSKRKCSKSLAVRSRFSTHLATDHSRSLTKTR